MTDEEVNIADSVVAGDVVSGFKADIVNIIHESDLSKNESKFSNKRFLNTILWAEGGIGKEVFSPSVETIDSFLEDRENHFMDVHGFEHEMGVLGFFKEGIFTRKLHIITTCYQHTHRDKVKILYHEFKSDIVYAFETEGIETTFLKEILIQFLNGDDVALLLPFEHMSEQTASEDPNFSYILFSEQERKP